MTRLCVVFEPCRLAALTAVYQEIGERLARKSIELIVSGEPRLIPKAVHIWQDVPSAWPIGCESHCIYGCRLLNRIERLLVAIECGVNVPTFFAPSRPSKGWKRAGPWVYKEDESSQGNGVHLIADDDEVTARPFWTSGPGDVVMRALALDGPTLKVDCFCGVITGCRISRYNPLNEARTTEHSEAAAELPKALVQPVAALARRLERMGTAYFSADLMNDGGSWHLIEVNTTGVARLDAWLTQRSDYVKRLEAGFERMLAPDQEHHSLGDIRRDVGRWRDVTTVFGPAIRTDHAR